MAIYWGAWVGSPTNDRNREGLAVVQNFENVIGKRLGVWNWLQWMLGETDATHSAVFNPAWMDEARNNGYIPMVSLAFASVALPQAGWSGDYNDIINGAFDSQITAFGQASGQWGHPYFLRFWWEFDGDWAPPDTVTPWNHNNTPAKFVAMWKHVVDVFRNAGGTNATWCWTPAMQGWNTATLASIYPSGNDSKGRPYVDWVGTDVYVDSIQNLTDNLFYFNNIRAVAPNKPFMFGEFGYTGANRATFWDNFLNVRLKQGGDLDFVKAFLLWEMPTGGITVTAEGLPSFSQDIASSYYIPNVYQDMMPVTPIPIPNETPPPPPLSLPYHDTFANTLNWNKVKGTWTP